MKPLKALRLSAQKLSEIRSIQSDSSQNRLRTLSSILHGRKPEYTSYADAVSIIQPNMDVYTHGVACTPTELLCEMCNQVDSGRLHSLRMSHVLLNGNVPWKNPKYFDKVRSNALFICDNMRKMVDEGKADFTPIFLSEIAELYLKFALPVDVAIISVSPPDAHGFCTMSVNVECTFSAVRAAKKIIALVNDAIPRTYGDSLIHSSHFDKMARASRPLYALSEESMPQIGEVEQKIGKLIAENLVDNGATLQLGIGGIPDATLSQMTHHKDLGVHTELLGDGVVDLIKRGVITNARKSLDPGKVVTSFAFGTKQLYDFIDNNRMFLFRTCAYTNNVQIIRKQRKMVAINSGIELDLTGQVSADSIGTRFYSGQRSYRNLLKLETNSDEETVGRRLAAAMQNPFYLPASVSTEAALGSVFEVQRKRFGGQVDYIYGTSVSDDGEGKPIIALPSVTPKGQSRIVPLLKEGAGVVTTRGHVRYIVTEYGIAQLWGKTVRQRAWELIQIAHPDHRERLEKAAFERLKCMPAKDR